MLLDEKLEFCDATSVASAAGGLLAGDVVDLDTAGRPIGNGRPLTLMIQVTTAFASAGAATVSFELRSDAAAAINTTTGTLHAATSSFPIATLVPGQAIILQLPAGIPDYKRYLGLVVRTAVATTTAGAINAFLVNDASDWRAVPEGKN